MTASPSAAPPGEAPPGAPKSAPKPQLTRSPRQKVVAGVCGGLGRYFDVDPVIFRVVLGVLAVAGGTGLIVYGFAWLLLPVEGEEENEFRRLLSGRVEGASLVALLLALVGCGLFLSMINNGGVLAFAAMLVVAVAGFSVWTRHGRAAATETEPDRAAGDSVPPAVRVTPPPPPAGRGSVPPEVQAPPAPAGPSWWRDPIVKDGTTGPVGSGYLWGPADAVPGRAGGSHLADAAGRARRVRRVAGRHGTYVPPAADGLPPVATDPRERTHGPHSIGFLVRFLAIVAGVAAAWPGWDRHPLGESLQIGAVAALAVLGVGLLVASFLGRTGFGTLVFALLVTGVLAASTVLPRDIGTTWARTQWRPVTAAALEPSYDIGAGTARLDLSGLDVPLGTTLSTRVEVGAGRVVVVVPQDATVRVRAEVGLGDVTLPGDPAGQDIDIAPDRRTTRTLAPPRGADPAGTVELRLEVGLGQVEVTRAAS
ncbi:PspC domain-containing protein [Streptomyces sp. NBC_00102]|uniref:PspC domain-containing protein n=1 Tax=Streptomyces sp. NBC_00102 TaxID=2975652 RepID=UPI00225A57F4|nr:PspC domain-containing protein [Streptomyces sp. NBC_00102]MCX5399206.1 PspC domain-containing protein [Streptomyces sp. NBC_00102]